MKGRAALSEVEMYRSSPARRALAPRRRWWVASALVLAVGCGLPSSNASRTAESESELTEELPQESTAELPAEATAEPTEEPRVLGQPRLLGRREFVPYDGPRYAPYDPELE